MTAYRFKLVIIFLAGMNFAFAIDDSSLFREIVWGVLTVIYGWMAWDGPEKESCKDCQVIIDYVNDYNKDV